MFAFLFNCIQTVTKLNVHNNEQASLFYALLIPSRKLFALILMLHNHNFQVGRDKLIEGSRGILQVRQNYHFFSRVICEFLLHPRTRSYQSCFKQNSQWSIIIIKMELFSGHYKHVAFFRCFPSEKDLSGL